MTPIRLRSNLVVMLGLIVSAAAAAHGMAQNRIRPDQPDMTIDAAMRNKVIEAVLSKLDQKYVEPDLARKMRQAIIARKKRGEYDRIASASAFGDSLTSHLRAVSHDRHIGVRYSHDPVPEHADSVTPEERAEEEAYLRARNYGFEQVDRLRGNVGYLRLRSFVFSEESGKTAAAAMQCLANTDALIIDLRQNGGGSGEMAQLLATYLMKPGDPVRLTDIYDRPAHFTQQFWTLPWVPGRRYDKPLYLLTSRYTFSAAEEFCYDLQNLKRVTIVGETTGGGAHPVQFDRLQEHFMMSIPYAKAVNPVSKTNWEGVGVKPEVAVAAEDALKTAHLLALKGIQSTALDPEAIAQAIRDVETTGESRVPTSTPR